MAEEITRANAGEVAKYLEGADFPMNKADIIRHAQGHHATKDVLKSLDDIPGGEYKSPGEVTKGLSK